ncbi:MAG TPA: cytochrome c oxidase subunit II [Candidatus Competibacteraceae bacterium]|nr:cytochrome c oxidase subunit II [Candidatus Competibacteraceae bacterium]
MALAIVLVLLVAATTLFHFLSPWWFTPLASNWGQMDDTLIITLVITGFVFIAINLFIAYAVIRYRHRDGRRAAYEPENKKVEGWLIGLTTVGIVAMLAPGLFVYSDLIHAPQEAAVFEALGQQWQWRFRFPGKDGKLGVTDIRFISSDNPFGLNPDDANGRDDILIQSSEVHLPLNRPVKVLLRSNDVLHDFYVPQFRVKMDLVPGMVSHFWFTPTQTGRFEILCAELCGIGHFNMRGHVVVEEDAAFQAWLDKQPTFAQSLAKAGDAAGDMLARQGRQLAQAQGCLGCHSVDGSAGIGPTWKGLYGKSERFADGGSAVVDEEYLKQSILEPSARLVQGYPAVMPPYKFGDQELTALIAYIKSAAGSGAADSEPK